MEYPNLCAGNRFVYWRGSKMLLMVKVLKIVIIGFGAKHKDSKRPEIENVLTSLIVGKGLFHLFGPKWAKVADIESFLPQRCTQIHHLWI